MERHRQVIREGRGWETETGDQRGERTGDGKSEGRGREMERQRQVIREGRGREMERQRQVIREGRGVEMERQRQVIREGRGREMERRRQVIREGRGREMERQSAAAELSACRRALSVPLASVAVTYLSPFQRHFMKQTVLSFVLTL